MAGRARIPRLDRLAGLNTMNKTTLAIIAALSASIALADDFKTLDGKEHKDAAPNKRKGNMKQIILVVMLA